MTKWQDNNKGAGSLIGSALFIIQPLTTAIEHKSDHAKISCVPKMYLKKNKPCDQ
jgi:hypothetical protein